MTDTSHDFHMTANEDCIDIYAYSYLDYIR
jgi:hypothetical protein